MHYDSKKCLKAGFKNRTVKIKKKDKDLAILVLKTGERATACPFNINYRKESHEPL
jgi:hypothetical protein